MPHQHILTLAWQTYADEIVQRMTVSVGAERRTCRWSYTSRDPASQEGNSSTNPEDAHAADGADVSLEATSPSPVDAAAPDDPSDDVSDDSTGYELEV